MTGGATRLRHGEAMLRMDEWGARFAHVLSPFVIPDADALAEAIRDPAKSVKAFCVFAEKHFGVFDDTHGGSRFSGRFVPSC